MHIVRFQSAGQDPRVGVLDGQSVAAVPGVGSIAGLLQLPYDSLRERLDDAGRTGDRVPVGDVRLLPPLDGRGEVWCAGVTYERSRGARMEESSEQSVYDKVYLAARPELFPKAAAWRVVTDGEPVGIRADSGHDVPEPELAVVVNVEGTIVGYTVCNDMSSRSIEGENPLYIPQAKVFAGGCALATGIRPAWEVDDVADLGIRLTIRRGGTEVFTGETTTGSLARPLTQLVDYLWEPNHFPDGVVLATGTGIVPELSFALQGGDEIEIEIDQVGRLVNTVVVGKEPFDWLTGDDRP